jgi:hypothetical protein
MRRVCVAAKVFAYRHLTFVTDFEELRAVLRWHL